MIFILRMDYRKSRNGKCHSCFLYYWGISAFINCRLLFVIGFSQLQLLPHRGLKNTLSVPKAVTPRFDLNMSEVSKTVRFLLLA
jgi:hypothetical protein